MHRKLKALCFSDQTLFRLQQDPYRGMSETFHFQFKCCQTGKNNNISWWEAKLSNSVVIVATLGCVSMDTVAAFAICHHILAVLTTVVLKKKSQAEWLWGRKHESDLYFLNNGLLSQSSSVTARTLLMFHLRSEGYSKFIHPAVVFFLYISSLY